MSPPAPPASAADRQLRRSFDRLTAWNILANLTVPLVGLVDLAILGHLDEVRHLAGVALGSVVFDYVYWSFGFLRMATTGLTAQAVGRGDAVAGSRVLARAALCGLVAGIAVLLLADLIGHASFALLSGAEAVEAAGRDYFDARILGAPAALLNLAFLGWFLGRAEGAVVLWMTAVGNLANLLLDLLFIVHWDMASRGAGLASAASQVITLAVAIAFWWRRRQPVGGWRAVLDRQALGMLRLGGDILVRTLCLTTVFALFTNASALLGTTVLAANALLLRVVSTAAYLVDGVAFATESLVGIAHGRRDRRALGLVLRRGLLAGGVFAVLITGVAVAFPGTLFGWLTVHGEVVARATADRWWLVAVMLPAAPAYVFDGLFLGLTAGRLLRNAMLLSLVAFALPAAVAVLWSSNALLWLALAVFMVVRTARLGLAARGDLLARFVPAGH